MCNLYIFGDSFSTNYNNDFYYKKQSYSLEYYEEEIKNGHVGKFKDLQFFLSKLLNIEEDKIINTAIPGSNNSRIFEKFSNILYKIKEGDYISLQTSQITRDFISNDIYNIEMTYNNIEKTYLKNTISIIKMVRQMCILSKVNFHIWTIDSRLNNVSTIKQPIISSELTAKKKYKSLKDSHPSFEGYEYIANNIVNNWETKKRII